MIKKSNSHSAGFTLLEAVIAMAVFSIGVLGMAALQTTAISSNTLAENVQENTCLAMSYIEELMAADYLDRRIATDISDTLSFGEYEINYRVLNNQAIPGAKKVNVDATFTGKGLPQTISLKIFKPFINVAP
jgi:prepilin-type N-terminal cleavage/methylation domain-containing protein